MEQRIDIFRNVHARNPMTKLQMWQDLRSRYVMPLYNDRNVTHNWLANHYVDGNIFRVDIARWEELRVQDQERYSTTRRLVRSKGMTIRALQERIRGNLVRNRFGFPGSRLPNKKWIKVAVMVIDPENELGLLEPVLRQRQGGNGVPLNNIQALQE